MKILRPIGHQTPGVLRLNLRASYCGIFHLIFVHSCTFRTTGVPTQGLVEHQLVPLKRNQQNQALVLTGTTDHIMYS